MDLCAPIGIIMFVQLEQWQRVYSDESAAQVLTVMRRNGCYSIEPVSIISIAHRSSIWDILVIPSQQSPTNYHLSFWSHVFSIHTYRHTCVVFNREKSSSVYRSELINKHPYKHGYANIFIKPLKITVRNGESCLEIVISIYLFFFVIDTNESIWTVFW